MKTRKVTLPNGKRFVVPAHIQRIDHLATHGWQLRYGGTRLYSDGDPDGKGARAALRKAVAELHARIARLPAPSRLQKMPNANKTSSLPVGISGPVIRQRSDASVRECSFSISLPRFGQSPQRSSVYIGTENTYSEARYFEALERAKVMREEAETAYGRAATRAKRSESRRMLAARAPPG